MDDVIVSIITPAYNSQNQIMDTYLCLCAQTHKHWEWVVTDDCSTDNTYQVLNDLALKDPRLKIFQNDQNRGAAYSRNNSLKHTSGEYIAFLDSDDLWKPHKISQQLTMMTHNLNINFSFTAYELIGAEGNPINKIIDLQGNNLSFDYTDMLKKSATLGCSTVMLRKETFPEIIMPSLRTGQDYALWLQILKSGQKAYLLNEVLTQYRILPNSISRNKFKKAKRQWEIYRKVENISLMKSCYFFCFYAWRAVFRR